MTSDGEQLQFPMRFPIKPMLAKPVKALPESTEPESTELLFEPKWDGFRCLVFNQNNEIILQSRSGKPLNRYFPEVVDQLSPLLPDNTIVDGELIVARDGRLDFDALTERIHPAHSRITLLAEQTPATYVAFDLLQLGSQSFADQSTQVRRGHLEKLVQDSDFKLNITPATVDSTTARHWFALFEGAGLDGIIGKPLNASYQPGKRIMFKYKHSRTADCVIAGLRWHVDSVPGESVGSLLLGLYDDDKVLHHVGVIGSFPVARRRELAKEFSALITEDEHPWRGDQTRDNQRLPGGINRWRSAEQEWVPLRPERVVEVSYEHTEGGHPARFRHNAQFSRWRPDRTPESCDYSQLEEPVRYDFAAILRGQQPVAQD